VFSPRTKPGGPSAIALAAGDVWWPKLSHAPFCQFLRAPGEKGLWRNRAPVLRMHTVQRHQRREAQNKHYHVLSLLLCKCPHRSFLNLGVIHFFLCNIFLEGRNHSSCPPFIQISRKPKYFGAPEQHRFLLLAVPLLQPKSPWSCCGQRKGHGVCFASAPVMLHPGMGLPSTGTEKSCSLGALVRKVLP